MPNDVTPGSKELLAAELGGLIYNNLPQITNGQNLGTVTADAAIAIILNAGGVAPCRSVSKSGQFCRMITTLCWSDNRHSTSLNMSAASQFWLPINTTGRQSKKSSPSL
ncbi:hypothetical protein MASR1M12_16250 [Erysipelotrichia bacterium]